MRNKHLRKVILLLAMLVNALPMMSAVTGFTVDGLSYLIIEGTTTVAVGASSDKPEGDVFIPGKVEYNNVSYDVVAFQSAGFTGVKAQNITSISGGSGITELNGAISNCDNLEVVNLPSIQTMTGAIHNCPKLSRIKLPNLAEIVSTGSTTGFSTLASLDSLVLPELTSVSGNLFSSCTSLKYFSVPKLTTVTGTGAIFYNCSAIKEIVLPALKSSSRSIASNCSELLSASCPELEYVNSLGANSLFYVCAKLVSISLPKLTSIEVTENQSKLAQNCDAATKLVIPGTLTDVDLTFFKTNNWEDVTFIRPVSLNVESVKTGMFGPNPKCLRIVGEGLQSEEVETLKGVGLPIYYQVGEEGDQDYQKVLEFVPNTGNYTSYTVENNTTEIAASACSGNDQLTSIKMQSGLKTIGDNAFYGCTGLTTVTIPHSVVTLGDYVFSGCSNLSEFNIDVSLNNEVLLKNVGDGVFNGTNVKSIYHPDVYLTRDIAALKNAKIDLPVYAKDNEHSCIWYVPDNIRYEDYTVEKLDGIPVAIAGGTFKNTTHIKRVVLPEGTDHIGAKAFYNSSIRSITIPSTVDVIYDHAFAYSKALESVEFKANTIFTKTGKYAFTNCTNLKTVTLPNTMTEIQDSCFYGTLAGWSGSSAGTVTLPTALQKIGASAFEKCKGLAGINLPGTLGANGISTKAFANCENLRVLTLSEGISDFADRAFSGLPALNTVNLPTTLTHIGGHFPSGAKVLGYIQIPASVTAIDGGFLQGCEGLRNCSLLGETPATLTDQKDGDTSFGPTVTEKHVNDCAFIVNNETAYNNYAAADVWKRLDRYDLEYNLAGSDNETYLGRTYYADHSADFPKVASIYDAAAAAIGTNGAKGMRAPQRRAKADAFEAYAGTGYHNRYVLSDNNTTTVTLTSGKWSTICLPYAPSAMGYNLATLLGDGGLVAELTAAALDKENSNLDREQYMYNLTFNVIPASNVVAGKPYLIRPVTASGTVDIPLYDASHPLTDELKATDVSTTVTASNEVSGTSTQVSMIGSYVFTTLKKAEFYLSYNGGSTMNFYKTPSDNATTLPAFKCFFRLTKNGAAVTNAKMGTLFMVDGSATGISEVVRERVDTMGEGIYNLSGQRVSGSMESLPAGVYIINGRKVVRK